jgi:hypothetical protein
MLQPNWMLSVRLIKEFASERESSSEHE